MGKENSTNTKEVMYASYNAVQSKQYDMCIDKHATVARTHTHVFWPAKGYNNWPLWSGMWTWVEEHYVWIIVGN